MAFHPLPGGQQTPGGQYAGAGYPTGGYPPPIGHTPPGRFQQQPQNIAMNQYLAIRPFPADPDSFDDGIETTEKVTGNSGETGQLTPGTSNTLVKKQGPRLESLNRLFLHQSISNRGHTDRLVVALRHMEATKSEEVNQTYENGELLSKEDKSAPDVKIAIYYASGATGAEKNHLENKKISGQVPVERPNSWKVLTAGSMLRTPSVGRGFEIVYEDITASVIQAYKERQSQSTATAIKEAIRPTGNGGNRVNIASENVFLVSSSLERSNADLEVTCIEVDGISLFGLITNFRELIEQKGRNATLEPDETIDLLEVMVEDARIFLSRSPILSSVSHRLTIQKSKNTRYGFDGGAQFHTVTTSRGIAEMIELSVAYYSTLNDIKEAQLKVRPIVMQMVMLLLSLLNDDDLRRISGILEKQYELRADRQSIELSILKVLPLTAVGSHHFLECVLSNVRMQQQDLFDSEAARCEAWNRFVAEISQAGWVLPGSVEQLEDDQDDKLPKDGSWKVRWNKFCNTDVFDHLQYCGEKGMINKIPPMKIRPKGGVRIQVLADFRNGKKYYLDSRDLDEITQASAKSKRYDLVCPATNEHTDLVIDSRPVFQEIDDALDLMGHICNEINCVSPYIDQQPQERRGGIGGAVALLSRSGTNSRRSTSSRQGMHFTPPKLAGSRQRNSISILSGPQRKAEEIAVAWVVGGKKIFFNDMLGSVLDDIEQMRFLVARVHSFKNSFGSQVIVGQRAGGDLQQRFRHIMESLTKVEGLLKVADEKRGELQSRPPRLVDSPILRVHFPGQIHEKQEMPWQHYSSSLLGGTDAGRIAVEGVRARVQDVAWDGGVATLQLEGFAEATALSTDEALSEQDRADEVRPGDTVLLMGGLMMVVMEEEAADGKQFETAFNFLRITSLKPASSRQSRRAGASRKAAAAASLKVVTVVA
jgi:hypothetical protein